MRDIEMRIKSDGEWGPKTLATREEFREAAQRAHRKEIEGVRGRRIPLQMG